MSPAIAYSIPVIVFILLLCIDCKRTLKLSAQYIALPFVLLYLLPSYIRSARNLLEVAYHRYHIRFK